MRERKPRPDKEAPEGTPETLGEKIRRWIAGGFRIIQRFSLGTGPDGRERFYTAVLHEPPRKRNDPCDVSTWDADFEERMYAEAEERDKPRSSHPWEGK
jgi:hypothetical protein